MKVKKRSIDFPLSLDKTIEKQALKEDRSFSYIVRKILTEKLLK